MTTLPTLVRVSVLGICLTQLVYGQQSVSAGIYAGSQPDSCGYGILESSIFPNGHLATLISSSPLNTGLAQGGCGACVQVTCTDPTAGVCPSPSPVRVQIIDQSSQGLQLSSADMAVLSPRGNSLGHVGASIQQVSCGATGSLIVRLVQLTATANGYIKLALLNVAGSGAASAVGLAPTGTQNWAHLKNNYGAVWEGSTPAAPPLDMQITSNGQTLTLSGIILASTVPGDLPAAEQFTSTLLSGSPSANMTATSPAVALSPNLTASPAASPNLTAASPNLTASPAASPGLTISPAASPNISMTPQATPASSASAQQSPSVNMSPSTQSPGGSRTATPVATQSPSAASTQPLAATTPQGTLFNLAAEANQGPCKTIFQVLSASPDLTTWVNLIQSQGLQNNLNGTGQGITMFAPINDAFSEPLLANIQGLDGAKSLSDLAGSIPSTVSTFLGYSVIPQVLSESQLTDKPFYNTTNRLKQGNSINGVPVLQSVSFRTANGMTQAIGVGSIATILQPNIQACGSVIHLVSNVLLPFDVRTFNLPITSPESSPNVTPAPATATSG